MKRLIECDDSGAFCEYLVQYRSIYTQINYTYYNTGTY